MFLRGSVPQSDGSGTPDPSATSPAEPGADELAARLTRVASGLWPQARVSGLRRLAGGASSLTYLAGFGGAPERRAVVKVAPSGLAATRNRDMLRQARVLEALDGIAGLRVPRVLFTDAGDKRAGQLVAMSFCAGESCEPNIDDQAPAATAAELRGRSVHAARMLAVTHGAAADLVAAEEPVPLDAEIGRWDRALATLPADFGLDWAGVSAGLRAAIPAAVAPRLTHGDYRLGNLLCVGSEVTAVIDWEIWAAADPRTDLGWFLLTMDPELHPAAVRAAAGVPGRSELLREYAGAGGVTVADADWFIALALYKFTATTGLIAKHAARRGEFASWGLRMIPKLPGALQAAADIVSAR
jgi:aminoglycoside phosphotransferase (APT) family kinase protein